MSSVHRSQPLLSSKHDSSRPSHQLSIQIIQPIQAHALLQKGDRVLVTAMDVTGACEGKLVVGGVEKAGSFPFTHITFADSAPTPSPAPLLANGN